MDLFGETEEAEDVEDVLDEEFSIPVEKETLCAPKDMTFCLGHEGQEALFIDLFKKNSLPHAVIFAGLEGIGKTTMAFRLARFLLKHGKAAVNDDQGGLFSEASESLPQEIKNLDVDLQDKVSHLISSGSHPDFLHIFRGKTKDKQDASLKVEAIRKIEPFLRLSASDGGWRVVLVEDADTMNRSAQNAILKILEEPPADVLIILIAHRPGMLIPTIHSRSRNIVFDPLSPIVMEALLSKTEKFSAVSSQDIEALTDLSEGSVGQAMTFLENDGLDMLKTILGLISEAKEGNIHKIHAFASSIGTNAQDTQYRLFTYALLWFFRKLLFLKARGNTNLPLYIQNDVTRELLAQASLKKLITLNDGLKNIFNSTDFSNLDRRDAVRSAFLIISQ